MLGLARAVDSFGASLMIILIPLYVEHYEIAFLTLPGSLIIGLILSIYGFTNTACQPVVGIIIDRLGVNKPLIVVGLAAYATATLAFGWVHAFIGIAFLRVVQGVGVALTIPPSMTLMTNYTSARTRGTAMSFYNVMRLTGFSTGPVVGGYLLTFLDFKPVLFIGASAGLTGALLVHFLVRDVTKKSSPHQSEIWEDIGSYFNADMLDFYKLAFANVTMALSISLVAPLENEFNSRLNQTSGDFGVAFSALIVTLMLVQIPIGRIADHYGRKDLIVAGLAILIPSTLWMGYVASTSQFILARMIQGIGVACVAAPTFALGGDKSSSNKRGREMSLLTMAFGLGIALGPLIAGLLAGLIGFHFPFWFGSGILFISVILVAATVPRSKLGT